MFVLFVSDLLFNKQYNFDNRVKGFFFPVLSS